MDEITQTFGILELIRDVYPVSFITAVLGLIGYAMGMYKYTMEIKVMERTIANIDSLIQVIH